MKPGSVFGYLSYFAGLILALFAYPMIFWMLRYYDYVIIDILKNFGVMVEIRLIFVLPLSVAISLMGLWLWQFHTDSLRLIRAKSDNPTVALRIPVGQMTCFISLASVALSILATLVSSAFALLVASIAYLLNSYPITDPQKFWLVAIIVSNTTLALGQIAIAFLIARIPWRQIQNARSNDKAVTDHTA